MGQRQTPYRKTFRKGAVRAADLVERDIRRAGEARGFAVTRLLTHWPEIVGPEIARIARPVDVSFSRGGMGASLTILVKGADAPMVEMQKEKLRERVNACYGYQAIRRVYITQTAASGFAEPAAEFDHSQRQPRPDPALAAAATEAVEGVADSGLRSALEALGRNVLARRPDRSTPK